MNKSRLLLFLSLIIATISNAGYNISVKIDGCTAPSVRLGYYYGEKTYLAKTAYDSGNSTYIFKGDTLLEPGIYMVIYNESNNYFEILVNDDSQQYRFETTLTRPAQNLRVIDHYENSLFIDYIKNTMQRSESTTEIKFKIKRFEEDQKPDSVNRYKNILKKVDRDFISFRTQIMNEKKGTFLSSVFSAMWEPEVPEEKPMKDGKPDPDFDWRYYKAHFWDKFPFNDARVLRTPVFGRKVTQYMDNLTVQSPDSIIKSVFQVIDLSMANKEMFKYTATVLVNKYEISKIMGFDAVFVAIVNKYYATGKITWLEPSKVDQIVKRAKQMEPTLIGKKGAELNLSDVRGRNSKLYNIDADYTVVLFWSGDCTHCGETTEKLAKLVDNSKGKLKVYAVYTDSNEAQWKQKLNRSFENVMHSGNSKELYDIYSVPTIYLLDKNKVILAKRLDVETLQKVLESKYKLTF